jgi:hypothetical protein
MVVAARIITDKLMIKVARVTDRVVVTAMVEAVQIMLRVDRGTDRADKAMAEARVVRAMVVVRDKVVVRDRDRVVVDRDRGSVMNGVTGAVARTTVRVVRVMGEVTRTTVRADRVTDAEARTMARVARAMAVDAARAGGRARGNTSSTATVMAAARA